MQEKLDNLDFIKIKNFYAANNTTKKVQRQPIKYEKIFADHVSDKELISRIYNKLLQIDNRDK